MTIRHNWTSEELQKMHEMPLLSLISSAHTLHLHYHKPDEVQLCTLISIKTGGCPEDCKYCAQSSRYQTAVQAQPLMRYEAVIADAKNAIARGATRICLGAAWREVRASKQFDEVLRMIQGIAALGVEVCCTLGMLTAAQAKRLKEAGLYAYNHNLDTSEEFYKTVITTRTYQERLDTLDSVQETGLSLCCGAILGMGEAVEDRLALLLTLSSRNPHPDSIPLNRLTAIPGTPLEKQPPLSSWELIRMVALTRIVMPKAMVRLSAGRQEMSIEEQALCFLAGANSIHFGEKLLTVPNRPVDKDDEMFQILGIRCLKSDC